MSESALWQTFEGIVKTKLANAPGCHDYAHTLRVLHNAELLLKTEPGADSFVVRTAALFHDFAPPETLAEKIVYDADKLDSTGAFGIARAFHFAGRIGACLHNTAEEAVNSSAYGKNDSAYREYLVKLRHLPGKMLTGSGRELAKERSAFMDEFFARLNLEAGL